MNFYGCYTIIPFSAKEQDAVRANTIIRASHGSKGPPDEDMTPMDMTMIVKYKVSSFLYLHNNFGYNLLGSTCTCQSLIVGTNVKLNFRFVCRLIVNHSERHNLVIRSAIEVHELLMESLFDKISNKYGPTSISHRQGLPIIKTFHHCFCRELRRCHGPNIQPWDPGPSRNMPQERG